MTSKERLLQLVASLSEEQAEELLRLATELHEVPRRRSLPAFVGMGNSGRTDVSVRAEQLLGEGFGR